MLTLFFFYYGIHSLMFGGYPPTAIGYTPTAIGYTPTAIGYTPTAIGCTPTAIGYPPTAIGYPPAAIVGRIGHSDFFFLPLWHPLTSPRIWAFPFPHLHLFTKADLVGGAKYSSAFTFLSRLSDLHYISTTSCPVRVLARTSRCAGTVTDRDTDTGICWEDQHHYTVSYPYTARPSQ